MGVHPKDACGGVHRPVQFGKVGKGEFFVGNEVLIGGKCCSQYFLLIVVNDGTGEAVK